MKNKFSFILSCFVLITTVSSCSEENSFLSNPLQKDGDLKNNNLDVKGIKKIENSNINFTGKWDILSNSSASGASYSSGANAFDNNSDVFKYVGTWVQNQTGNSAPTYALGGSMAFGYATPVNVENNATNSNLSYAGSDWNHTGSLGSSVYSFNSVTPSNSNIEYDSPSFTYNGTWTTVDNSYKTNDATFAGNMELTFTGTNVYIIGYLGPDRGIVNFTLLDNDGKTVKTINNVDLYAASQNPATLVTINGLLSGIYRLRMETANTKNESSTGDRYDVIRGLSFPAIEYKFTGSHLRYQALKHPRGGNVKLIVDGDASNSSLVDLYAPNDNISVVKEFEGLSSGEHRLTVEGTAISNAPDGYNVVTFDSFSSLPGVGGKFYGSTVDFYLLKHPAYGIMKLWIDGELNQTVDLSSASPSFQAISVSGLTDTTHDFSFQATGGKNESATNNYLNFDGLIAGVIPKASYTCTGNGITYIAAKGPDQGNVEVFYDNVSQGLFNLYSATPLYQQTIFKPTPTNPKTHVNHTIEIRAKNTKSNSVAGLGINVDAFDCTYSTALTGSLKR